MGNSPSATEMPMASNDAAMTGTKKAPGNREDRAKYVKKGSKVKADYETPVTKANSFEENRPPGLTETESTTDSSCSPDSSVVEEDVQYSQSASVSPSRLSITCVASGEVIDSGSSLPPPPSTHEKSMAGNQLEYQRLFHQGLSLERKGQLDAAMTIYNQNISLNETVAVGHFRLGVCRWKVGAYGESLNSLKIAGRLYRTAGVEPPNDDLAEVFLAMGRVYLSLGNHRKSKKTLKKAILCLEFDKQASGKVIASDRTKLLMGQILLSLGQVFESSGDFVMALGNFKDAVEIQREAVGNNHVDIASSLLSFGSLLEKTGDLDTALSCFEEAQHILHSHKSEECYVDESVALANIGWIHYLKGNCADALAAYEDSLKLQRSVLGKNHRNIASVLTQTGMVFMQIGRVEQALGVYKDALRIQRKTLGDVHEDTALTLSLSATAFARMKDYKRALQSLSQTLKIRKELLGDDHNLVAETHIHMGDMSKAVGRAPSAIIHYNEAKRIYLKQNLPGDQRITSIHTLIESAKSDL